MGLCGCTAIAITGEFGSIVAHISPNLVTFQQQMDNIRNLFQQNIQGQQAQVYLFGPAANGIPTLPQFTDQIRDYIIQNIGAGIIRQTYESGDPNNPAQARLGTLLVQLAQGALYVWINNQRVNN